MDAEVPVTTRLLAGRYRLGSLLGRGGMAEVYDGHDERLDRPVAVKLLRPELAANGEIRDRFEVEARAAARLSHPNVVGVFDTGEDEGDPFIVMERLPGETLADRMRDGPVDEEWLRRVAGDVLAALAAAHAAGVVHRDVKPGNILLAADGCAKVADFGIAKSAEVASDLTGTGMLVGTPAYLAPERLDGEPATFRSDLYSLGVMLYEALTGTKPYPGSTPVAVAAAVAHHNPHPLHEVRPGVDPDFAAAVEQAMAKDPARRPASAREMAARLAAGGPETRLVAAPAAEAAERTLVDAAVPGAAARAAAGPGVPLAARRPPPRALRLPLAAGVVVLLLVLALVGGRCGGGGDDRGSVATAIEEVAERVEGAGPKGPEAAERLDNVASQVRAGGGADDAAALVRDAAQWGADGSLSPAAADEIVTVLDRVPGVDATALTTTTTTTTTTPTTLPPVEDEEDHEDEGEEKGKGRGKGKGRD